MLFSMLVSPLPPSLLDTYSLSTLSLGCNALCMVISFLVLWSISLSFSLVHFKNGPEYLPRGQSRYLSFWQSYYDRVLSRVIFWFFWDTLFKIFLSFPLVWCCQLPLSPSIPRFPFLRLLLLKVFHTGVSWWSFTVVWITASFLRSPGLFSVFWPISTML